MDKEAVVKYFQSLDRSLFIENDFKEYAGINRPLPIGYGQTISQPTLVLEMTLLLDIDKGCKVLEIGTGSGYQTAFLAEFSQKVYTVEKIAELSQKAWERLHALGYQNIDYKIGDGSNGWKENSPFDRIMVTAAAGKIPEELVQQLNNNGRMIVPVGEPGMQDLNLITKDMEGRVAAQTISKVTFVEFKGQYGWGEHA